GTGTGTNGGFVCIETDPVITCNVTPINPVLITAPTQLSTTVNIAQFNPTFTSRSGADVFQVEISTDRTFSNPSRIFRVGPIFSTAPNSDSVTQSLPNPVDLRIQTQLTAD